MRDFEEAIEWLVSAGMLNRIYNVSKMEHPLSAFDKLSQFKLFLFDTGPLKHMAGIDNSVILLKADYQFKGPLTENYVLQQLHGQFEVEPRYHSGKTEEIDFVLQNGTEIIPVEVKDGEVKSSPSFKRYIADHHPERAIRFSKRGVSQGRQDYEYPASPRQKDKRAALTRSHHSMSSLRNRKMPWQMDRHERIVVGRTKMKRKVTPWRTRNVMPSCASNTCKPLNNRRR